MIVEGINLSTNVPLLGVSILSVLFGIFVFAFGIVVVKIALAQLYRSMVKAKMTKLLADFTTRVLRIIGYIFVVGISLSFFGFNVGAALISISVVLGFVLGFALGDTLSNIAGGFMIAVNKPFKKDDYVTVNGESGSVLRVGVSVTELTTPDNKHVIIPNKLVWGSNVVNFTKNPTRRVDMVTSVSYNDDLELAIKTSMDVIRSHPKVLKDPEPFVAIKEMADSSVNLVLRPWAKTEDYWAVYF
ncbi:MAG TPA: mechanosensitive ion channel family protein, partial [Euryarchaeota archaeon]|nr:mechanosensitive ion channel family protein [Euryarchaeota archaeon]